MNILLLYVLLSQIVKLSDHLVNALQVIGDLYIILSFNYSLYEKL